MSTDEQQIQALMSTVAELKEQVTTLERAQTQAGQRLHMYQAMLRALPLSTSIWHLTDPADARSVTLVAANGMSQQLVGTNLEEQVGQRVVDLWPNDPYQMHEVYAGVIRSGQPTQLGEVRYVDERLGEVIAAIQAIPLSENYLLVVGENITERTRADEALRQSIALEETVRAQNAVLAELSTPLIPISDTVVVMPLIGAVDTRRAQQVLETLLTGIAETGAEVAILDITGVSVVDTQVANALVGAAQAVKLLGARVILTGIRPEVAQTLVGLGVDLAGIITRGSLQSGIALATEADVSNHTSGNRWSPS